jgi:hypothetical protein
MGGLVQSPSYWENMVAFHDYISLNCECDEIDMMIFQMTTTKHPH